MAPGLETGPVGILPVLVLFWNWVSRQSCVFPFLTPSGQSVSLRIGCWGKGNEGALGFQGWCQVTPARTSIESGYTPGPHSKAASDARQDTNMSHQDADLQTPSVSAGLVWGLLDFVLCWVWPWWAWHWVPRQGPVLTFLFYSSGIEVYSTVSQELASPMRNLFWR